MNAVFYLVIQGKPQRGYTDKSKAPIEPGAMRITKQKPDTAADEIAVRVVMEIPEALFRRPSLEASITIPAGSSRDAVITAEVQSNIAAIIREQTGLTVTISATTEQGGA